MTLHSGVEVNMAVHPAKANTGINFKRVDIKDKDHYIKAIYSNVSDTDLCTKISNNSSVGVQTIEHLMAAFAGTGIHNALVEVDGPELPILDGSARHFVKEILSVGLVDLG